MDKELQQYMLDRIIKVPGGCWEWVHCLTAKGYGHLGTTRWTAKYRKNYAHQLSYIAWKGVYSRTLYICHRCSNPKCCNPDHLYAGTQKENMKDRDALGRGRKGKTQNVGISNGACKLSESEVKLIRELKGTMYQKTIAALFGVSRPLVSLIHSKENWKHV